MTNTTAADLITAARIYNADYAGPEFEAALAAGTPVLDVSAEPQGRGWSIRIVATPGFFSESHGFIAADDPSMLTIKVRDGRESAESIARRTVRTRYAGAENLAVRVRKIGC